MTRQMAGDEVLRVLRQAATTLDDLGAPLNSRDVVAACTAFAALQAERDALRADVEMYQTNLTEESSARFDAEHALEALRGQVEGLVELLRGARVVLDILRTDGTTTYPRAQARDGAMVNVAATISVIDAALLAIKERMG